MQYAQKLKILKKTVFLTKTDGSDPRNIKILKFSSFKRHFALKLDEEGLKNYPILVVNLNPFLKKITPKSLIIVQFLVF